MEILLCLVPLGIILLLASCAKVLANIVMTSKIADDNDYDGTTMVVDVVCDGDEQVDHASYMANNFVDYMFPPELGYDNDVIVTKIYGENG